MSERVEDAIILAGGSSSRIGSEKALLEIDGQTFLARAASALAPSRLRIGVSVAKDGPSAALAAEIRRAGLEVLPDLRAGRAGPLAGIEAGLAWARGSAALVLAVDMVGVDAAFIAELIRCFESLARSRSDESRSSGLLGLVPIAARVEPLCAIYATALLPAVRARLDRGELAARDLALEPGVERVDAAALGIGDRDRETVFRSVNTPGEYRDVTR